MKLHTIIPGKLYQRGEFPNAPREELHETLRRHNIQVIVGLAGKTNPHVNCFYVYEPIADGAIDDDTMDEMERIANEVMVWAEGGAILTHCHGGRNRSALMSALLVMRINKCSASEAIELVRSGRPNSLANEHFVKALTMRGK